jgi:DNA-binding response OmpR family regulator
MAIRLKRILVAEDNKLILETIAHSLMKEGYIIVKAPDGKECLRLLENTDVDLVITDMYMPFVNGDEVITVLREERKKTTPILVLSATESDESAAKILELGANDFMIKPFSLVELNDRVRKLLALKR